MIRVEKLNVAIGKKQILKNVDFTAEDGEFVALIGPNGSGKSTLLRSVAGMIPYKGSISLDKKEIDHMKRRDYAKRLAMVSQFNDGAFELTVMDMVLMGRSPYHSFWEGEGKEDLALAEKALEEVGLSDFRHRPLGKLSGGERQRVVLARALVQETDHMLLDEATNHLDVYYQMSILSLVKALDTTVIAALHGVNHAFRFADRIVALKNGEVLFNKTPDKVDEKDLYDLYGIEAFIGEVKGERVVRY